MNQVPKSNRGSETGTPRPKPRLTLASVADLAADPPVVAWDVEGVVARHQPMVIGGPPKSLKTSLALDLGVSLATGTPFLGRFKVPKRRRVAVFSGESGRATVYETANRILRARSKSAEKCHRLSLGFKLPRLAVPADRIELRRLLEGEGVEVVVIDPLYLCLFAGGRSLSASNLFDVGAVLGQAAEACIRAGATPVFVHHTTKSSAGQDRPTALADLSFAGVGEFARQWLLLSRWGVYASGTGRHDTDDARAGWSVDLPTDQSTVSESPIPAVREDLRGLRSNRPSRADATASPTRRGCPLAPRAAPDCHSPKRLLKGAHADRYRSPRRPAAARPAGFAPSS